VGFGERRKTDRIPFEGPLDQFENTHGARDVA
jgi:hypothetical protein